MNKKAFIRYESNGIVTRSELMDLCKANMDVAMANANPDLKGFYWVEEVQFGPWLPGQVVFNVSRAMEFERAVNKVDFSTDYFKRQAEYLKAVTIGTDIIIQNIMSWRIKDDPDFN